MIFPAGLVSRKQKNQVQDLEWRKTFISRAKKHETTIYPVFIEGEKILADFIKWPIGENFGK